MGIKPFLHKHYLLYDNYDNKDASCNKCNQEIHGRAYNCESCNFWLHKDCAEEQLPRQVSRSFHSQHPLILDQSQIGRYICDKCSTLSRGHKYCCYYCNLKIDVSCAACNTNDEIEQEKMESKRFNSEYTQIYHFVHRHGLRGTFNYRKVEKKHDTCDWCEKHLSESTYACFECKFYIHATCLVKIPTKIQGHPFHPLHPLYIQTVSKSWCNACKRRTEKKAYRCQKCEFNLHVLCSRLQPSLKHEIHEHGLTYFRREDSSAYHCNMCDKNIYAYEKNIFSCGQCDFNAHFRCLGILPSIKHEYHIHSLILLEEFIEDDSGEYYCDICEEERKAKDAVYCCENCTYIVHIQCALNKVDSKVLIPELKEQDEREKDNAKSQNLDLDERQIEHFIHEHPLNYNEVIQEREDLFCRACFLKIYDEAYGCDSCNYYLHKTCAKLSFERLHPRHPQHPLKLFAGESNQPFRCHECRGLSVGFNYVCYLCSFILDVKCATKTTPNKESQRQREMSRESKLCPFGQVHDVFFFNFELNLVKKRRCDICFLQLSGPTYGCIRCKYYLHESCLGFPREIELPLIHPEHTIHPILFEKPDVFCLACGGRLFWNSIVYNCGQCQFLHLHLPCANSLRRALLSKAHKHPLFYFRTESQRLFANFLCDKCNKSVSGVPFYRCLFCGLNFHLECGLIPHSIKSKCHIHPLTLRDCFKEDDSGEYYCDICEEERHPKDHIYFCEECGGFFVAHIECVLNNMEKEIEAAAEELFSNLALVLKNTFAPKSIQQWKNQQMNSRAKKSMLSQENKLAAAQELTSYQAESQVSTDDSTEEQQSNNEDATMEESTEEQQSN